MINYTLTDKAVTALDRHAPMLKLTQLGERTVAKKRVPKRDVAVPVFRTVALKRQATQLFGKQERRGPLPEPTPGEYAAACEKRLR